MALVRSFVASALVMLLALSGLGCGNGDETAPIVEPPGAGCAGGEWLRDDGVCVPAGLPPDMPCAPAEWLRDDGACIPAGVPPDGCGEGFVHDGDRGCEAILPAEMCGPGLMAVPGERICREVAPCASGSWGDIPVEPDTEYVDASYAGMDSDGSALKPWTTVQDGVDAASAGAIVAVAEGSYIEDVTVMGKFVRLWGVCPALVEVVGAGVEVAAVQVFTGASNTEVRSLAIRGERMAFALSGSLDVLLEQVWVKESADRGLDIEGVYGPTSITLRGSLVERSHAIAVYVSGSEATVEASVLRDTQWDAQGLGGYGILAPASATTGVPSTLLLRSSLLERNHKFGMLVEGSEATVDASVVRNTLPNAQGLFGRGVHAQASPTTGAPAMLLLHASLVAQNYELGVLVDGSEATVEASVVRDTVPDPQGFFGRGVNAQAGSFSGAPSTLVVRTSLIERNHELGVFVSSSDATVEASVVRDTLPDAQGLVGRGVNVQAGDTTGAPATLLLHASLVERSHGAGVFVAGADATVEASVVRDTLPDGQGLVGRGVNVQFDSTTGAPSTLLLHASLVEQSHEASVAIIDSVATIDACLLSETRPSPARGAGEGVMVISEPDAASATITRTRIHQSALAAVAAWGAHAAIGNSALSCHAFDLNSESYQGKAAELEDLGGNLCGCPEPTKSCKAVSAGLEAPPPLEPVQDDAG